MVLLVVLLVVGVVAEIAETNRNHHHQTVTVADAVVVQISALPVPMKIYHQSLRRVRDNEIYVRRRLAYMTASVDQIGSNKGNPDEIVDDFRTPKIDDIGWQHPHSIRRDVQSMKMVQLADRHSSLFSLFL